MVAIQGRSAACIETALEADLGAHELGDALLYAHNHWPVPAGLEKSLDNGALVDVRDKAEHTPPGVNGWPVAASGRSQTRVRSCFFAARIKTSGGTAYLGVDPPNLAAFQAGNQVRLAGFALDCPPKCGFLASKRCVSKRLSVGQYGRFSDGLVRYAILSFPYIRGD